MKIYAKALLAVISLAPLLTGCAHQTTGTTAQMCETWRDVSVSKKDVLTKETASEIAGNNVSRSVWCTKKV